MISKITKTILAVTVFYGLNALAQNTGIAKAVEIPEAMDVIASFNINGSDVLTDDKEITIYTFDSDKVDETTCFGGCLNVWPPVLVDKKDLIEAPFGTLVRPSGDIQLTIDGLPLYYFFRDKKPGDIFGQYPDWRPVPVAL